MIIAIDGPAASGKGTLARRLAVHYGFAHLDTGLIYRAVAAALLARGVPLSDETAATDIARDLDLHCLDRESLSAREIAEAASRVAAMPTVRIALCDAQRAFAAQPPGAVLDGRDIGTVICPYADVKLFVTATLDARARRRWAELRAKGDPTPLAVVRVDLSRRDARDRSRRVAPLTPAPDAHLLDTTEMDIDGAFAAALRFIER